MCETVKIDSIYSPPISFDAGKHVVQVFVKKSDGEMANIYAKFESSKVANDIRDLINKIDLTRKGIE